MRKTVKKQLAARIRFLIIFFILFGLLMPTVFIENYNNLFLNKLANSNIQVPKDITFINQAESTIANNGISLMLNFWEMWIAKIL